ncbi:hypothetical protein [Nannocystis pusilla]|uniref:hypothetical protein n=1 Tax=Nannocystis pusilla TaxID=889268 RepID=UPI003B7CBA02
MIDCDCVFDRPDLPVLGDDELLEHVERCGTCPKYIPAPAGSCWRACGTAPATCGGPPTGPARSSAS